jgi:hypothetical protein
MLLLWLVVSTSTTVAQEAVLPQRVSLSIGSNKYVIVKAIDQSEDGELLPGEYGPYLPGLGNW